MPKFTIISGSIKQNKKVHTVGAELEISIEDAALFNKKHPCVELSEVHNAKKKAAADAKATIEKAEKEALEKLDAEAKKSKGGAK